MNEKDIQLLKAISSGDIKVFEDLFRFFYPALCGYSNKILNSAHEAEEVVQDVFYTLWKSREKIDIKVSIKSYLYRSVYYKSLNLIEHKGVINKYIDSYKQTTKQYYSPEDALHESEIYSVYNNTLNQLPERCRQIFQMSRDYGLKYSEIAEKLTISVKTVEANMGKALKAFRLSFAEYNSS